MAMVRTKEQQAEAVAHLLDDVMNLPGLHVRIGVDPIIGLVPIIGDALATVLGSTILVVARQLNVPWPLVFEMAINQLKNGLLGSIPFLGDAYSFYYKSNAVNAALLLRTVKAGQGGACPLTVRTLTFRDLAGLAILILPIIVAASVVSSWFAMKNVSYISLLFLRHYFSP